MICIIALVVFSLMAVFSARYRPLAKEAFNCVFRKLTLRKCETDLNKRIKSQLTGKIMVRSPKTARFVYRHFETISWFFTLMMLFSFAYSAYSIYNFVQYGNCYGPEEKPGEICIFNALQGETNSAFNNTYTGPRILPSYHPEDPTAGSANASVTIIEFGCYMCPYSRQVEGTVQILLKQYGDRIHYVYRDFPVNTKHALADMHSEAARCAMEQGKYWEYRALLFSGQESCSAGANPIDDIYPFAVQAGLDLEVFRQCYESRKYTPEILADFNDGILAGVKGTPTFFINNRTIIGPKPIKAFTTIIDEELRK